MANLLGAIGEWPWVALMFGLAHWKTAVAVVWGGGFAWLLFKEMRSWYKTDAYDASVGKRDEDAIFVSLKELSRERRGARLKKVFTQLLLWLPLLAFNFGKKIAKAVFYPILVVMDKAQTEGLKKGKEGVRQFVQTPNYIDPLPDSPKDEVLVEGVNALRCMSCNLVVSEKSQIHECKMPPGINKVVYTPHIPVAVKKQRQTSCSDCGNTVVVDAPHTCDALLEKNGMVKCGCGTIYKEEADFDHVCPEEDEDDGDAQCKDCSRSYDPSEEVHVARFCRGCSDAHCTKHDCGQLANV